MIDPFNVQVRQPQDDDDRASSSIRDEDSVVTIAAPVIGWSRPSPRPPTDLPMRYRSRLAPFVPSTGMTLSNPPTLLPS